MWKKIVKSAALVGLLATASATSVGCARNGQVRQINERVSALEQRVMVLEARTGGVVVQPTSGGYYR